jgi:putative transposase
MAKPIHPPSRIAQHLKGESSKWVHIEFSDLRLFGWQNRFGAFWVSKWKVPDVVEYIKRQRGHHERESFEEEYERLMKLHAVEYDPQYLLD